MSDDNEMDEIEELEEADGYGPPPDDPMTFDASEAAYGRGRLVLVLVIVMVFAAVGIFYAVYQQGTRERGKTTPPVITAEKGPTKVEPDDPGGMVVEHQDKLVYDTVSGEERQQVEVLLPESEEPVDLSGLRTSKEEATAKALEALKPKSEDADRAQASLPTSSVKEPPLPHNEVIETIDPGPGFTALPKAKEPEVVTPKAVTADSASRPATSGSYIVQVAAFPEAQLAAKAWETLKSKHTPVVGHLRPDVQVADLGAKGIWYRLRIGPFDSKPAAQDVCDKLKARGQDCLVRTP